MQQIRPNLFPKSPSSRFISKWRPPSLSKRKHKRLKKKENEKLKARIERIREEMEEISEEQESIREGQKEIKVKIEAIGNQCKQLRQETNLIMQQSANTQQRLCLMFRILKARDTNDFVTANNLTQLLRNMITKQMSVVQEN